MTVEYRARSGNLLVNLHGEPGDEDYHLVHAHRDWCTMGVSRDGRILYYDLRHAPDCPDTVHEALCLCREAHGYGAEAPVRVEALLARIPMWRATSGPVPDDMLFYGPAAEIPWRTSFEVARYEPKTDVFLVRIGETCRYVYSASLWPEAVCDALGDLTRSLRAEAGMPGTAVGRVAEIQRRARDVLGEDYDSAGWLRSPHSLLDGQAPEDISYESVDGLSRALDALDADRAVLSNLATPGTRALLLKILRRADRGRAGRDD